MANTHNVVTVTPYIPAHLVNEAELDILHQVGFDYVMLRDKAGQMAYSFYAEQGMDPEAGFNANDPRQYLRELEQAFPNKDARPEWVFQLMEGISQHIRAEGGEHIIDAEFLDRSVYIEVFQGILQKRECTLSYLTLEGALWCDKVRPGEFGGHAARIYSDRVVAISTPGTIEVLEGIAQAAQNALNSWEHGDLAGAMRDLRDTVEAAVPGYLVV